MRIAQCGLIIEKVALKISDYGTTFRLCGAGRVIVCYTYLTAVLPQNHMSCRRHPKHIKQQQKGLWIEMKTDLRSTYTDVPATTDGFAIGKYIDGLSEFICKCNTPMTIAIQGDWGTGKTSIMNMVLDKLKAFEREKPCGLHFVEFNTWQYSQFNMENQLSISLMSNIIDKLNKQNGVTKESIDFKNTLKGLGNVVKKAAYVVTDYYLGGEAAEQLRAISGDDEPSAETDPAKAIELLKTQFQNCVNKIVESKTPGKPDGRVIIFVDDLDRLQPMKAVEFLESMKLFLDCDRCVFVLAIDYGVVTRGVKAKYGQDFDDEKGRSFFDKIIQVPFKMPVAAYDIDGYVQGILNELGIVCGAERLALYSRLIRFSIGRNPRSMKRLFNAYSLLNIISRSVDGNEITDPTGQMLLFATLCMQMAYEGAYNDLVGKKDDISAVEKFLSTSMTYADDENEGVGAADNYEFFIETLRDAMQLDDDSALSEEEINKLRNVLTLSATTAVGNSIEMVASNRNNNFEEWEKSKRSSGKVSDNVLNVIAHLWNSIRKERPNSYGCFAADMSRQMLKTCDGGPTFAIIRLSNKHFMLSLACDDYDAAKDKITAALSQEHTVDDMQSGYIRIHGVNKKETVDEIMEFITAAYDCKM